MNQEQRTELMRRYNLAGMARDQAEMNIRAIEQAEGMRNAYPSMTSGQQAAMMNANRLWRDGVQDAEVVERHPAPIKRLSAWGRLKRWLLT